MSLRMRGLRWWMISLIMVGAIVNDLTRSTLAVAATVGAFQVAIMFQPICGDVLDVIGVKVGLALFALAWSIISMAHGLAHNWVALFWLRGVLGLAEGSANPAG